MIIVGIVNLIVGLLVGVSGIAGFLLPIFYVSVMKLNTVEALALSFSAFIVSGVLGSINYYKARLLNVRTALIISAGSFIASFLGVKANLLIPEYIMQKVLYIVVLLSGLSILLRKNKDKGGSGTHNMLVLTAIGFVTGFICSISGAGGPILVLPVLIMLGIGVHEAVAIALFNSIFIGIPAASGYMLNSNFEIIKPILPVSLISHGIGVLIGSKNGNKINQNILKKSVAVFSILIAAYKLLF
ncbi:sulfite exporter TauE/SafE family protein [Lacrimispora sp.]|uniref:sulfite exporter TauE/SafE family protein n=1 Tax=Lacrimispora sp. TaxID=2719234 RepID=UPI00345FBB8E